MPAFPHPLASGILEICSDWATKNAFWFPLPPRLRFVVHGPDAFRFLQGQTSNDLARATPTKALLTCLLTVKGRIVSVPTVWRQDDETFLLEVPQAFGEETLARLERYLVADAVEIHTAPAPAAWHLCGFSPTESGYRQCARLGLPGFDTETAPTSSGAQPLSSAEAESLRIALRVPGEPEWREEVFPAEVGLDRTAVDFHKGCYLGQEVVSRLESVGQARRVLVRWFSEKIPPPGSPLQWAGQERAIGRLTSVLPWPPTESAPETSSAQGSIGLALVRREGLEFSDSSRALFALPESSEPVSIHFLP